MIKIKPFVFFIIFIASVSCLYAEAPELKNVMPNSWRKVTKLTVAEEQVFAKEHSTVIAEMNKVMGEGDGSLGWQDGSVFKNYVIYRQQAGTDTFYRVLYVENGNPNFLSRNIRFCQFLIYQKHWLIGASYNAISVTQRDYLGYFCGIDIIEGKEKAKGILSTELVVRKEEKDKFNAYVKGQLHGGTNCEYYFMEDIVKNIGSKKRYLAENCPVIEISASHCLVDQNIPLRYSLQNAFDGDPATSYVENTDDDLMKIEFMLSFSSVKIKKIAIINGYAQDMTLYKNNNRVKTVKLYSPIRDEFYDMELADNTLGWQYIEADDRGIMVKDIYRGNKYNDTCIAEFNLYLDNYGWLFGDIDE